MMKPMLEICCGSFSDVKTAYENGADRVELNSALYMGGLTPTLANLIYAKENCNIPVVAMVRPRGVAQLGSAFGSGPKGRVFKSRRPDQIKGAESIMAFSTFCFSAQKSPKRCLGLWIFRYALTPSVPSCSFFFPCTASSM